MHDPRHDCGNPPRAPRSRSGASLPLRTGAASGPATPASAFTADPPGLTTHHIEIFDRRRVPGPLWSIDSGAEYASGIV